MRFQVAVPESYVSAPILNSGLEAVTRLNEAMIRGGDLEPFDSDDPQAQWRPEPPGEENFDHGRMVQGRGWGDCDDLAPWHAASLRVTGQDPEAQAIVRRSGPNRWHAVVRRSNGSIDDPSADAGMHEYQRSHGVVGAAVPVMLGGGAAVVGGAYVARPQLAMRPIVDRRSNTIEAWQARTDLPWHQRVTPTDLDTAMVSLHASPHSDQALVGAIEGAILIGEENDAPSEHLNRLCCISDMVQGACWEECAAEYGPHHADAASAVVGGLFGRKFRRKLKKMTRPVRRVTRGVVRTVAPVAMHVAPKLIRNIPGVGPLAAQAFQMASPALQKALMRDSDISPAARFLQKTALPLALAAQPGLTDQQRMRAMQELRQVPGSASTAIPAGAFAAWM
jgi:hypothetical protein